MTSDWVSSGGEILLKKRADHAARTDQMRVTMLLSVTVVYNWPPE